MVPSPFPYSRESVLRATAFSRSIVSRRNKKVRRLPARLRIEQLEARCLPTTFTPTTFLDGDFATGSLRNGILLANADTGTATDTIKLLAGTYQLTLVSNGQQTDGLQGDLDITNTKHPLVIEGAGTSGNSATIIDASQLQDRVFQIVNLGTQVLFENLVIQGGLAKDDGSGALGATSSFGGGILNNGGSVTLTNVLIQNNVALGGNGPAGGVGQAGGAAKDAAGGGIYSVAGVLSITNSTIVNNQAIGGQGGSGGASTQVGGAGGQGGGGFGGGIFASLGAVHLKSSQVDQNQATGGAGGAGGPGGPDFPTGGSGGPGGAGGIASGGGMDASGVSLTLNTSSLLNNQAHGGAGGRGGDGGPGAGFFTASGGNAGAGGAGGSAQGAGLLVGGGIVSLSNSTFSTNISQGGAGGAGGSGGSASFGGNGGAGGTGGSSQGGGLYLSGTTSLSLSASTIDHNQSVGGTGGQGGIGDIGFTTGFSGAGGNGGAGGAAQGSGLFSALSTLTIINSTIPFNTVQGGTGGNGGIAGYGTGFGASGAGGVGGLSQGGGLFTSSGTIHLLNDTVAQNQAFDSIGGVGGNGHQAAGSLGQGGGGFNAAALFARNTIFGEDKASLSADFLGPFSSAFNNLLEDGTGSNLPPGNPGPNGNIVGTTSQPIDPLLGPLANNGGPTQTMALDAGSPAIDTGTSVGAPTTDQRGDPRGTPPDIGAYESQTDNAALAIVLGSASNKHHDSVDNLFAGPWLA
jgi:hypothetical protein